MAAESIPSSEMNNKCFFIIQKIFVDSVKIPEFAGKILFNANTLQI